MLLKTPAATSTPAPDVAALQSQLKEEQKLNKALQKSNETLQKNNEALSKKMDTLLKQMADYFKGKEA